MAERVGAKDDGDMERRHCVLENACRIIFLAGGEDVGFGTLHMLIDDRYGLLLGDRKTHRIVDLLVYGSWWTVWLAYVLALWANHQQHRQAGARIRPGKAPAGG